jgi:hypothetical protein
MANACAFCGNDSRRLTDEHVFGNWVSKLFAGQVPPEGFGGKAQIFDAAGNLKEFAAIPFQQVVKIPCEVCNTGWMRGLEEAVIPFLTPMILGERTRLRPPRQKLLATWCVKTALVMDHLHPRARVVPDDHYHELYRYRQPLAASFANIGYRREIDKDENGELLGTFIKQPLPNVTVDTAISGDVQAMISEGRRIYVIIFAIGHFVAQVIGHDLPAQVQISTGNAPVQRIWRTSPRFDWPASRAVDDIGGIAALHRASMQQPPVNLTRRRSRTYAVVLTRHNWARSRIWELVGGDFLPYPDCGSASAAGKLASQAITSLVSCSTWSTVCGMRGRLHSVRSLARHERTVRHEACGVVPFSGPSGQVTQRGVNLADQVQLTERSGSARTVVSDLVIPTHSALTLTPFGDDIVLQDPHPYENEASVPLTLTFRHAGAITIDAAVTAPGTP